MASLRSLSVQKRCPENFIWRILPHIPLESLMLMAWAQKTCAKFGSNDSVRSVICRHLLLAAEQTVDQADMVHPLCP